MTYVLRAESGTDGALLTDGAGTLTGFSVRESAGTPGAASFVLRDGVDDTGAPLVFVQLGQGDTQTLALAVSYRTGLFLDRTDGETEAAVYIS